MDRLKIFRFTAFQYFVNQLILAEGSTEAIQREIWPSFQNSTGMGDNVRRILQMNTRERLRAMISFIDLLMAFNTTTRTISQPDWVVKVNKIFEHNDNESSNTVGNADPAAGVYELLPVKVPGGGGFDYLSTLLKGCAVVSLDELFISAGIQKSYRDQLRQDSLQAGNSWRIKCPYGDVELFVKFQDAAELCMVYGQSTTAPVIIHWLQQQASKKQDNPADLQRLRLLEAVDSTKYIITLLGTTPETGQLVLLRASDGHVHAASFMRACVGLPLREQDVRDDHTCGSLGDLLDGPITLHLDDAQMVALTLAAPRTDRRADRLIRGS